MSLMINQNITSLNAWRNLNQTDRAMSNTMEKLSSGLRINKAADDPSGLVISEQMRAQVVGLKAAIKNSEKGISMVQTAEGALDKVHGLLDKMRGLALDSANNATSDANMLAANQAELDNILETITRISENTQYGTKKLLDGSNDNTATVLSDVDVTGIASDAVRSSSLTEGTHGLVITETKAGGGADEATFTTGLDYGTGIATDGSDLLATTSLSIADHTVTITGSNYENATLSADLSGGTTDAGVTVSATTYRGSADATYNFTVTDGAADTDGTFDIAWSDGTTSGTITYNGATDTMSGDTAGLKGIEFTIAGGGTTDIIDAGDTFTIAATASTYTASLDGGTAVTVYSDDTNTTLVSGLEDGGEANFDLSSLTGAGTDTIYTEAEYSATLSNDAGGTGTAVTGIKASAGVQTFTESDGGTLSVDMSALAQAGTVKFTNTDNSLVFQVGANENQTVRIGIQDIAAEKLSVGVSNSSGFSNLASIDVTTAQAAQDAIALIDNAIDEISVMRGELGAFQANTLEANLDSLRVAAENLQASESVIRDTDMAAEMATFTKYQIMMQAGTSMLAQANQIPNNLLSLLR